MKVLVEDRGDGPSALFAPCFVVSDELLHGVARMCVLLASSQYANGLQDLGAAVADLELE